MDNFDIALLKETHINESKVLEFRMEHVQPCPVFPREFRR